MMNNKNMVKLTFLVILFVIVMVFVNHNNMSHYKNHFLHQYKDETSIGGGRPIKTELEDTKLQLLKLLLKAQESKPDVNYILQKTQFQDTKQHLLKSLLQMEINKEKEINNGPLEDKTLDVSDQLAVNMDILPSKHKVRVGLSGQTPVPTISPTTGPPKSLNDLPIKEALKCKHFTNPMPERVQRKHDSETPVEFFDLKSNNTYIDNFDYYHAGESLCKLEKGDDKKLMIVVVLSDTSEGSASFRHAIRETWGGVRRLFGWSLRFAFVMGENKDLQRMSKIATESEVYGDIVQGRFDDTYLNITDKTIASFRWTQEHCSNAIYMMRITHDTVLNPQKLIGWANEFYNHNSTDMRLYFGAPLRGSPIIYDQNHKNRIISQVKWPKDYYPPYHSGCGFLSSLTFIRDVNAMFCRTPITAPDDGYVGAIAEALGVTIYEHPLFPAHYAYLNKETRGTINPESTFVHFVASFRPEDIYDVMVDVYQMVSGYKGPPSNTSSMTQKHTVVL